jgi:hypothetical protein
VRVCVSLYSVYVGVERGAERECVFSLVARRRLRLHEDFQIDYANGGWEFGTGHFAATAHLSFSDVSVCAALSAAKELRVSSILPEPSLQ